MTGLSRLSPHSGSVASHGLSPEASKLAGGGKQVITIPMRGGTESLNAATAAAVILFEAARQRRTIAAQ